MDALIEAHVSCTVTGELWSHVGLRRLHRGREAPDLHRKTSRGSFGSYAGDIWGWRNSLGEGQNCEVS